MSKLWGYLGYVLLAGVAGSVILSLALMMWVWIRSSNPPQETKNVPPTVGAPTRGAQLVLTDGSLVTVGYRARWLGEETGTFGLVVA